MQRTHHGFGHPRETRFAGGLLLVGLAALLMLVSEGSVAAPITLLSVGIVLIATSRREGRS